MRLSKNPGIEEAPLQGELMLFDPNSSKFFVLNRTMAFVWRNCDGERSSREILHAMSQEFSDFDHAAAEADLDEAIEDLRARGLISTVNNSAV
ncbi:MAG: PqqD family protein [Acidobacteriota bacterium]